MDQSVQVSHCLLRGTALDVSDRSFQHYLWFPPSAFEQLGVEFNGIVMLVECS